MNWPPKIPPCPKPLRDFFQALIDRATASWPIDGFNVKVADAPGGRSINAESGGIGGGGVGKNLQIRKGSDDTHVGISKGKVAEQDADSEMDLVVAVSASWGTIWASVDIALDDTPSNLVIFDNGTAADPDQNVDDKAFTKLGRYRTVDDVLQVEPEVSGSQGLAVCRTHPDNYVRPTWGLV